MVDRAGRSKSVSPDPATNGCACAEAASPPPELPVALNTDSRAAGRQPGVEKVEHDSVRDNRREPPGTGLVAPCAGRGSDHQ